MAITIYFDILILLFAANFKISMAGSKVIHMRSFTVFVIKKHLKRRKYMVKHHTSVHFFSAYTWMHVDHYIVHRHQFMHIWMQDPASHNFLE